MAKEGKKKTKVVLALSQYLEVSPEQLKDKGLLNTVLGTDTKLFIDPKLLRITEIPEFKGAIDDMEEYFSALISTNALAAKFPMARDQAINMLAIKEPTGLSIGYGDSRDSGTSIPKPVALKALRALSELVAIGLEDEKVLEMIGLYVKKFASDSISDLTAHIIYARLCAYTQRIAKELGIATTNFEHDGVNYMLPQQPTKKAPIILLPLELLSPLPLATSWEEIATAARQNAQTRKEFNKLVGKSVKAYSKKTKEDPGALLASKEAMAMLMKVYDEANVKAYSVERDSRGYIRLSDFADQLGKTQPREEVTVLSPGEMVAFVKKDIIEAFQYDIEVLGANELLYQQTKDGKAVYSQPLREDAAQILFHIAANHACGASNILMSREPKLGKSAVDFWIGTHPENKVLVEIKKSNNKNLVDGYDLQVERYLKNERASAAFYVVVVVSKANKTYRLSQLNQLRSKYAKKVENGEKCPILIEVDALEQTPPSKLRSRKTT